MRTRFQLSLVVLLLVGALGVLWSNVTAQTATRMFATLVSQLSNGGSTPVTCTASGQGCYLDVQLQGGAVKPLCASGAAVSAPADTSEDILATCTVPANTLGANGSLRVWTLFSTTNSANAKNVRVRYSGAAGTQFLVVTMTTSTTLQHMALITNRGATNSQVGYANGQPFSTSTTAVATSAVDTTAATDVVVTCQKASAGETCTLERYVVELIVP